MTLETVLDFIAYYEDPDQIPHIDLDCILTHEAYLYKRYKIQLPEDTATLHG